MTSRRTIAIAMDAFRAGPPVRMRANNFGNAKDAFSQAKKRWDWAIRVLERKPCGARRRRDGKPCQALNEPGRKRCRWHGGLSTGPKTPAGKARSLANLRQHQKIDRDGAGPY